MYKIGSKEFKANIHTIKLSVRLMQEFNVSATEVTDIKESVFNQIVAFVKEEMIGNISISDFVVMKCEDGRTEFWLTEPLGL